MPSDKPAIFCRTDLWIVEKMKFIAEENGRSLSKEVEMLCRNHIKKYEIENGEIKL